jgi:hypothetical protein
LLSVESSRHAGGNSQNRSDSIPRGTLVAVAVSAGLVMSAGAVRCRCSLPPGVKTETVLACSRADTSRAVHQSKHMVRICGVRNTVVMRERCRRASQVEVRICRLCPIPPRVGREYASLRRAFSQTHESLSEWQRWMVEDWQCRQALYDQAARLTRDERARGPTARRGARCRSRSAYARRQGRRTRGNRRRTGNPR